MKAPTRGVAGHDVMWCFHTTAMVHDYERCRDALVRLVGLRVLEDTRIEVPAIGRRGGMAWVGDNIIEIGEPIVPGGAVDRFVRRFGSHMSSVAVQVADIDATVDFLGEQGVRIASRIDGDIVFTHPADTAGVVIEWYGGQESHDPRFGAVMPPPRPDPILDVRQMAFGGAVVADPIAAAERLAELFGHGVTFRRPDADDGSPVAGVSMGDVTLALYRIPRHDRSHRLWGYQYERAQTCNLGLRVADLTAARHALGDHDIAVIRDEVDQVVIDPRETGGVTIVVVDNLLDGDDRR